MTKYKIGIWGQFGNGIDKIADGQAVRTTIITEELKNRYGNNNVKVLNTNNWKKQPFKFLWDTINLNAQCDKVIIAPADNGFKVVCWLLNFTNAFFRKELFNIVIGGYLPGLLKKKPRYVMWLKKYKALFVQTINIKKDLEKFGLNNVQILSNLKRLNTVAAANLQVCSESHIKLCTLSRINEVKGIEYAINGVKVCNEILGKGFVKLDIYGVVADDYQAKFSELLKENKEYASYGGILDFNKTVETLKDYFAMLFPTYYYGEGFPGNVVDAYNAGIPIIATDWLYNKDVIMNGKNGILVPIKDSNALADAIIRLYNNRDEHYHMCVNNIKESEKYTPDVVLRVFYSFLD